MGVHLGLKRSVAENRSQGLQIPQSCFRLQLTGAKRQDAR